MASYDSILETVAVRVVLDDAGLKQKLNRVKQTATTAYQGIEKAQEGVTRASRQQARAQDDVSESIRVGARLALTLRREYENDIITTKQFKEQATALRRSLLQQATQVERTTKSYDRAQLGAQRLSTALATVDGRTSKLGFSANVTTGVMGALNRRLVASGPAGQSAAAGLASLGQASTLARAGLVRLGTYIGSQLIPIFATFAGIAGVGLLTRGLGNVVQTSFDARISLRLFNRELQNSGQSIDAGADALTRLAQRFRSTEDSVAQGAVQLLRYGATLEQTERLLEAGGASALAFGRTASAGFDAVAQAIVGEQSQILNRIGIAGNLSTAYRRYASDLGTTTEALTRQQKVQAALNLILEETGGEIEALDEIMSGFGGALTQLRAEQRKTSIALGDEFRDELAQIIEAAGSFLRVFREQIVPFLGQTLGPAVTTAAENISALSDSLNGTADPFSRAGQAVTGFLTPIATLVAYIDIARGGIEELSGRLNQFGELILGGGPIGAATDALDSLGVRILPEGLQNRLGFEQPALEGGGGRGGSTPAELAAARVAAGRAQRQAGQELLEIIRSGDPNAIAAALFGAPVAPAAAPAAPPPLGGATGGGAGSGAGGAPKGTESDPITVQPYPGYLMQATQGGSSGPLRTFARTGGGAFTGDLPAYPDSLAQATRVSSVGPLRTFARSLEVQRQADLAEQAGERIADSLASATARGIEQEAERLFREGFTATQLSATQGGGLAGELDLGLQRRIARDAQNRALLGSESLGTDTTGLLRSRGDGGLQEARAIVRNMDAAAREMGRWSNAVVGAFAGQATARSIALGVGTGAGGTSFVMRRARDGDGGLDEARRIIEAQEASADAFANQVVTSAFQFTDTLIDSIRNGDIGQAFQGLLSGAGSIFGSAQGLGSLPFLGGSIGIGTLIQGGLGILGSLFGLATSDGDSPAANSAQSRRSLSTLELNFTFNQTNSLGLLDDPQTTNRLSEVSEEAFRRFEDIIKRNINPRLDNLEARVL